MEEWSVFCQQNNVTNVKIFKPDGNLRQTYRVMDVWGVITKEGNCYSIGVGSLSNLNDKSLKVIKKMNYYKDFLACNILAKRYKYYYI